jgi:hypothetical protein
MSEKELTPMNGVLEDAVFFFSGIDLQGKRECAADISSAKCETKRNRMIKLQNERLKCSPDALAGYFHFGLYLTQLDQLQGIFGVFAVISGVKSRVSIAAR